MTEFLEIGLAAAVLSSPLWLPPIGLGLVALVSKGDRMTRWNDAERSAEERYALSLIAAVESEDSSETRHLEALARLEDLYDCSAALDRWYDSPEDGRSYQEVVLREVRRQIRRARLNSEIPNRKATQ